MRTFRLTDSFIEQYKSKPVKWGFGAISHFTYKRTYSREKPDGSRERWWETVRRVVEGTYQAQLDHCVKNCLPFDMNKAQRSAQRMYQLIFEFKFLPPGRGLEHMGSDALKVKGGAILQNCGFVSTANIAKDFADPFCFLMDFSALGVGIGFDTRGAGTMTVKGDNKDKQQVMHVIQDSREGWVAAMRELLESYAYGKAPLSFDYSQIRPEGAPLKTLGGTASGPEPLRVCLERIRDTLEALRGKLITSVAITDIMNFIGCAIVAGGTRRSAEIALGDPNDLDFISMKDRTLYPTEMTEYRWASNNSVIVERGTKVDYDAICDSFAVAGEPGILWLDNAREYGRMGYSPDYGDTGAMGVNPCLVPGTLVHTSMGHFPIESLVGKTVDVWNGDDWVTVDNFRETAKDQPTLKITLHDGSSITATPYHKFILENGEAIEARFLSENDRLKITEAPLAHGHIRVNGAYAAGFIVGDGQYNEDAGSFGLYLYEPKYCCEKRILGSLSEVFTEANRNGNFVSFVNESAHGRKRLIGKTNKSWLNQVAKDWKHGLPSDVFAWDLQSKLDFIAGVMDSDGTAADTKNGFMYQVTSCSKQFLADFQVLLKTVGVKSTLRMAKPSGKSYFEKGGWYEVQASWRLTISQDSSIALSWQCKFSRLTSFADKSIAYKVKPRWNRIASIEDGGVSNSVYCCTEPSRHQFALSVGVDNMQCGEQILWDHELCTLVEVLPSNHDDVDDVKETIKYAYLYAKSVTLIPTHDPRVNAVMQMNRRIGMSQTGIVAAMAKFGTDKYINSLDEWYDYTQHLDAIYSDWLCVPRSRRTSTVKPSGTVSIVAGVTPGIHAPHSPYSIRRIRVQRTSPVWKAMADAGYEVEESVYGDNTMVVSFPVDESHIGIYKDDLLALEQLELAATMQAYWSDNGVSVTVTFRPVELPTIKRALPFYARRLKAVSFLPYSDHGYAQAPYEAITKERYEEMVAKIKPVDFDEVYDRGESDKFCEGDKCLIG